jgi:hypothetical protein
MLELDMGMTLRALICALGHRDPQTPRVAFWHIHCWEDAAMNMHVELQKLEPSSAPAKPGLLRRILTYIAKLLASPKGDQDQGGWEGGARGL